MGIIDRVTVNLVKIIKEFLESMSKEEKQQFESETSQTWENLYNEQKRLQEIMTANKSNSLSQIVTEYVEREDPFNNK